MGKPYVYLDAASGVKLVLSHVFVACSACGQLVPMAEVGMRRMRRERLEYRNQPRCAKCRRARRRRGGAPAEPSGAGGTPDG